MRQSCLLFALAALALALMPVFASADSIGPKILLVEDSHQVANAVIEPYYTGPIESSGYVFSTSCASSLVGKCYNKFVNSAPAGDGPSVSTMSGYDMVVWFTGRDYSGDAGGDIAITANDRTNIASYLNSGNGSVFLTGEDVAFDLHQQATSGGDAFLSAYFNASEYSYFTGNVPLVIGTSGDPIGTGLSGINITDGAFFQSEPDIINTVAAIKSIFYDRSNIGSRPGMVKSNTSVWKTVFSSFAFEGIGSSTTRNTIMDRILKYLSPPDTRYTTSAGSTGVQNLTNSTIYINATCLEDQLFGSISAAEFFVDSTGQGGGSGIAMTSTYGVFGYSFLVNVTGTRATSDLTEGNHTAYVHCKNSDGKWGKFDQVNFTVDRTPPGIPTIFIQKQSNSSTNQVNPLLSLGVIGGSGSTPDYFSLSCNGTAYTEWTPWVFSYTNFNITNSTVGCNSTDGTRTVYIRARDAAGNVNPSQGSDSIDLDRINPKTLSISPANQSFLNSNTNITIQISDENSGIKNSTYNNGTATSSFSSNTPFNQVWPSEGVQTLRVDVFDNAGNLNESVYTFKVDNTPPTTTDNSSNIIGWKSNDQVIGLTCVDSVGGIGGVASGCNNTLYCVDTTGTCSPSTAGTIVNVTCVSGSACQQYVRYYSNDTANNTEPVKTSNAIKIDKSKPSVAINSPSNNQYIKGTITINSTVSDTGSGVDKVFFNISNSSNYTFTSMTLSGGFYIGTFDTTTYRDGNYNVTIFANDTVSNLNSSQYVNISIDNTPPVTTDNSTTNWYSTNQSINLTCSDGGSGCNTTLYCLGSSCTPLTPVNLANPIINITCALGSICIQAFRYQSNDTLNNLESIKSNTTMIDMQAPNITIQTPVNSSTYSGVVQLITIISDSGSGINRAWYDIRNQTNLSQVVQSGLLNTSNGWSDTWNSSNVTTGTFVFNVSSNDTVGNLNYNKNVTFLIDNNKPTITIISPKTVYRNFSFSLDIRAVRPNGNVANASWYIYNSSKIMTSNRTININSPSFNFTDQINLNSSWADGNYTLNASVNDTTVNNATDITWFAIDRAAPNTTDNSSNIVGFGISKWNNTDQTIGLSCSDGLLSDGTTGSGCHKTLYCVNTTGPSCTPTTVGTPNLTVSVSCPSGSTCINVINYTSNDTAGNMGGTNSSNVISIDKQAPTTTDNSTTSWYGIDQSIRLTCSDSGSGCNTTFYCTDTSGTCSPSSVYSSPIPQTCTPGNICTNFMVYRSNDSVSNFESNKISNQIKIDKQNPSVSIYAPSNGTTVRGAININATVTDSGSGVNQAFYNVSNNTFYNLTQMSLTGSSSYGSTLNTSTLSDGTYNISIYANDTVNNVNSSQYVTIGIDNTPPVSGNYSFDTQLDTTFGDYRIYTQGSIIFYVNATDATNTSMVVASINGANSTLSLLSGSLNNGVWSANYTNTTSLGLYTINNLYINDTLGNSMQVAQAAINKSFRVVNATVNVSVGGTTSIDASDTQTFSMNFSFNKTVSNPNVMMFVPPNTISNFSQAPNYVNASSYACAFSGGCSLAFSNDSSGKTTLVNITGMGNGTTLNISTSQTAQTPSQDSTDTWTARFNNVDYTNSTRIKVPFLNISLVACSGSTACIVNQNANFTLNMTLANVNQSAKSGKVFAVTARYSNANTGLNSTLASGDILSNASYNASWTVNITQAGNFTFSFDAYDRTLRYNATTVSVSINVTDTQPPYISSVSTDNSLVNLNDSVSLTAAVSDNINVSSVIAQINDSSGYVNNYTMSLLSGTASSGTWNLTYNNTTSVGNYSINKIYTNDTTNNMLAYLPNISFQVLNFSVAESLSNTNVSFNSPVTIYANVSGNATAIASVIATITKPRNFTENINLAYNQTFPNNVYRFAGTYANVTRSGNYTALVNASTNKNASDSRQFSVNFGNATLSSVDNISLPVNGTSNLAIFVIPSNGDLINVTGYLNISNQTTANITSTDSFVKIFGNITFEDNSTGFPAFWTLNESNIGTTNFIIVVNSTFNNISANKTIVVNVVPTDTQPPTIISTNQTSNRFNLLETNTVRINATDNTAVANVTIEMTYPLGEKQNLTAAQVSPAEYDLAFSNTNETGNYSFRSIAFDVAGNFNSSSSTNFSTFNNYTIVTIPGHTIYNKGENISITVQALNVNNQSVSNFNLTLILDRAGSNITLVNNQTSSQGSYVTTVSDNPTSGTAPAIYTIYSTAGKNGNFGNNQTSINISKVLATTFISPLDGTFFNIGDAVSINVQVTNARGEPVTSAKVAVQCSLCSNQFTALVFNSSQSYFNPSAFITPSTSNKKFSLFAYSVDLFKNDQGSNIPGVLLTTQPSSVSSGTGSSGGGAGGGGSAASPTGIELPSNLTMTIRDFEFTLSQPSIDITKGGDSTLLGMLSNKGNVRMELESSMTKDCCKISVQKTFSLSVGESKSVDISIHVPLYTREGEYLAKVSMLSNGILKEQSFKIVVKENALIADFNNINASIARQYSDIDDLRKAGVDTGKLDALMGLLSNDIASVSKAIREDNLDNLTASVASAKRYSTQVFNDVIGLQLTKFLTENKFNIAGVAVSALVIFYIATQIWMPYYTLRKEIVSLAGEEKSLVTARVEAEKQYFLRKINEATFFTIMSQKQGEILKVRSRAKVKNDEVANFIVKKLHPFEFFFWLKAIGNYVYGLRPREFLYRVQTSIAKSGRIKFGYPARMTEISRSVLKSLHLPKAPRLRFLKVIHYNTKWYASRMKLGFYRAKWAFNESAYALRERFNLMLKEIKFMIKSVFGW